MHSSTINDFLIAFRNLATDPQENQTTAGRISASTPSASAKSVAPGHIDSPGQRWSRSAIRRADSPIGRSRPRWINEEPVQERDRIMMAMLRSLGIEKGKPFQPDARMKKILTEATLVGEAMAKANDFDKRQMELSHYADGVHWHLSLCLDISQEAEFYTQLDERAAWFYEATATSAGMVTKTPGVGSVYLGTYKDKDGDWLDGANTYRLHVPPNAPVKQFWSLTVYDVATRCLINNKEQLADRSSRQPDLVKNADGSVDLYVGPKRAGGLREELDSQRARQGVVSVLPPLRPDRSALRSDVDSAGFREGELTCQTSRRWEPQPLR